MDINDAMIVRVVERFRSLADETRIRLLLRLQQGPCNISTLASDVGVAQASVSKHIAVLRQVGFVQVRKVGVTTICSIRDPSLPQLCQLMCAGVTRHVQEEHADLRVTEAP